MKSWRAGAALPMALFALCLIGGLTVGGAFVARRSADDARVDQRALELSQLAEQALGDAVGSWDLAGPPDLAVGSALEVNVSAAPGARIGVWLTRIGPSAYWLLAEASLTRKPLLRKRMGMILLSDSTGVRLAPQVGWFGLP